MLGRRSCFAAVAAMLAMAAWAPAAGAATVTLREDPATVSESTLTIAGGDAAENITIITADDGDRPDSDLDISASPAADFSIEDVCDTAGEIACWTGPQCTSGTRTSILCRRRDAPMDLRISADMGAGADDVFVNYATACFFSCTERRDEIVDLELAGGAGNDRFSVNVDRSTPTLLQGGDGDDDVTGDSDSILGILLGAGNDRSLVRGGTTGQRASVSGGDGTDIARFFDDRSTELSRSDTSTHAIEADVEGIAGAPRTDGTILRLVGDGRDDLLQVLQRGDTGQGRAIVAGNGGNDVLLTAPDALEQVEGGAGNDILAGCDRPREIRPPTFADPALLRSGVYCDPAPAPASGQPARRGADLRGGEGDDLLIGGTGTDLFDGGGGTDIASAQGHQGQNGPSGEPQGVTLDLSQTPPVATNFGEPEGLPVGTEGFEGTPFDDTFIGTGAPETVRGGPHVVGEGPAFDALRARLVNGDDTLSGRGGDDVLIGGVGDDIFEGGAGNDRLEGDVGDDLYRLGEGADAVVEAPSDTRTDGSPQAPEESPIVDPATGLPEPREFFGDAVSYASATGPVAVYGTFGQGFLRDPADPSATTPLDPERVDTWSGRRIEIYFGSPFDDFMAADSKPTRLAGLDGRDALLGGDGDDQLDEGLGDSSGAPFDLAGVDGSGGDDELLGGGGRDRLVSGPGADRVDCGTDAAGDTDIADYSLAPAGVNVTLGAGNGDDGPTGDGDSVLGCNDVFGSAFDDQIAGVPDVNQQSRLSGDAGDDVLTAGPGGADMFGEQGDDRLVPLHPDTPRRALTTLHAGGEGSDELDLANAPTAVTVREQPDAALSTQVAEGGPSFGATEIEKVTATRFSDELTMLDASTAPQTLAGGASFDSIDGGGGDDTVDGGAGNDIVRGGPGEDVVQGGPGDDDFRLADGVADASECDTGDHATSLDPGLDAVGPGCALPGSAPPPSADPPPAPPPSESSEPGPPPASPPLASAPGPSSPPAAGSGTPSTVTADGQVAANGTTAVTVGCTAPEGCAGVAQFTVPATAASGARASRARRVVIASARYRLEQGQRKRLTLRLSRRGRALLRKRRTLRVTLRVVSAGGGPVTTRTLTLRARRR